jgi:hypothetical protein
MKLYCNLSYNQCFDCDGEWVDTEEADGLSASFYEGMKTQCFLPFHRYGKSPKSVKLISEFKWLMNRAIYRGEK